MTRDNPKKKLAKNISSLFVMQMANYLLPMVSLPVIVRIIGPGYFGVINYAAAIVAYFVLLINYGFNLTATRTIARSPDDKSVISRVFSEVLFCKLLLMVVALLLFALGMLFVSGMKANPVVMWFSFSICLAWVLSPDWLYQGIQQLHKLAIFNFATKILFTIFILLVIRQPGDYYFHPLLVTVSQLIVAVSSFLYAWKKYHIHLQFVPLKSIVHILYRDRAIFLSSMVVSLYNTTNTIILATVSTNTEVGYYTAAQRFVAMALSLVSMPFAQSLFPFVGKAFGESKETGVATVRKMAPIVIWFSFICASIMFLAGPFVTGLFYGEAFHASKTMFRVMSFSPFLVAVSNILGVQVMLNLHMDKPYFWITAIGAAFSIVLTTVLSIRFGGLGTSFASISTEFVITLLMFVYLSAQKIHVLNLQTFNPFAVGRQMLNLARDWKK